MKKYTVTFLLLALTSISYAKEKKVQHDAHEHGVAEMNIVWDKAELNIELLSPAFNITGFEHQPSNHEQEEAIEMIEKKLNVANELFEFKGASCKAVNTKIDSPFDDHEGHDDHEKHKTKDDHAEHDEHQKKDEHDDHKEHDKHDEHAEESSTHSEYSISYKFSCENTKLELTIETAKMFKHLTHMEKIKVQWLSATQQSSSVLSKKSNTVILK